MARRVIQQTVVTDTGDVIPNASVEIRRQSNNALVNLYDSISGGSAVTNPFQTDAEGFFEVYADAPEFVKIEATGAGGDVTFQNVALLGTAADADLTESATDTTAGRVWANRADGGQWGWGAVFFDGMDDTRAASRSGAYSIENTTANKPAGLTNGVLFQGVWANNLAKGQLIVDVSNDACWMQRHDGAAWQEPVRIDPQGFGLGTDEPVISNADLNTLVVAGNYRPDTTSPNLPVADAGSLIVQALTAINTTQTYATRTNKIFIRAQNNTTWSSWKELYHTGNLNVNEFEGASTDAIAYALALSSTTAVALLPISSTTFPTSITVTGTFSLFDSIASSTVQSGISAITLSGSSSKKAARIVIPGTGFSAGSWYELRAEGTSKIEVNF